MTDAADAGTSTTLDPGTCEIRVVGGRVVLATHGDIVPLAAAEIVAALQGAGEVQGLRLARSPAKSCPGTVFRPTAVPACVRLETVDGALAVSPVLRLGELTMSFQMVDDHGLIGREWHPIEVESLGRLRTLMMQGRPAGFTGPVSVERVYAVMGLDLVEDRLSDADVWSLGPDVTPPPPLDTTLRRVPTYRLPMALRPRRIGELARFSRMGWGPARRSRRSRCSQRGEPSVVPPRSSLFPRPYSRTGSAR